MGFIWQSSIIYTTALFPEALKLDTKQNSLILIQNYNDVATMWYRIN